MKATYFHAAYFKALGAIALSFGIGACVPSVSQPAPAPAAPVGRPAPAPAPAPAPIAAVQEPVYESYLDAPQTPGTWGYAQESGGGVAFYRSSNGATLFALECDRAAARIMLYRASNGQAPRTMTLTAETTARTLQASAAQTGHIVNLIPRDPILDAIAITKGRFAVGMEGERTLYLPAWVEVSRVIEDCR